MRDDDLDHLDQIQSDLDMLLLENMYQNAKREGRLVGGRQCLATSGWRNCGIVFWIVLALLVVYWFFLRPLGL